MFNKWPIESLGSVAKVQTGYPFDSSQFSESTGFPVIRIRDIKRGYTSTYYTGQVLTAYVIKKGDLLIGMDGEFNLGRWKADDALLNQRSCKITFNDKFVNSKYGYYFLPKKLKEIEDSTAFVTVKHLSHKQILSIPIPLPPLSIQKQIADILEKADQAKQKRQEANKLSEQFLQSAFIEMFGDPFTNSKKWPKIALKEACNKITDGEHLNPILVKNGQYMITAMDVQNSGIDFSRNNFVTDNDFEKFTKKCKPERDDVLLVSRGATIGRTTIVNTDVNFCLMGSVILMKPKQVNPYYLVYLIRHKNFSKKLLKLSPSSAQQAIYIQNLKELIIPLPDNRLQLQFASLVQKVGGLKDKQKQSEQELDNLFNCLMQKAFNGDLF